VLLCVTVSLMPTLLPASDELAMNVERAGVPIQHISYFSQHFCELGVNFAENVGCPSMRGLRSRIRVIPIGFAYGGTSIRPVGGII
jgi:hypothetical protein